MTLWHMLGSAITPLDSAISALEVRLNQTA